MKKRFLIFVLVSALLLLTGCAREAVSAEKGECIFGTFTTTDMAKNPINQDVFLGHKLTMVNIWATFCKPCIIEMPDLSQLQAECSGEFLIIGIVADAADRNGNILPEQKAQAASIIESTGADYLHILPSASLNSAYLSKVQAVPETVFVDENGNQIGGSYLGAKSKEEWKTIVEALLKEV